MQSVREKSTFSKFKSTVWPNIKMILMYCRSGFLSKTYLFAKVIGDSSRRCSSKKVQITHVLFYSKGFLLICFVYVGVS